MSFDKDISNYTIKFKDEISYLEAKLENLKLYSDIPFIGFIQNEMYDKEKCEVEGIDPTQYTSEAAGAISNHVYVSDNPISEGSLVGFASGNSSSDGMPTVAVNGYNSYGIIDTNAFGTGDVHISGDLIVDGSITWGGDSNFSPGPGNYEQPGAGNPVTFTIHENPKEEPPEDPIDNRFDILDL